MACWSVVFGVNFIRRFFSEKVSAAHIHTQLRATLADGVVVHAVDGAVSPFREGGGEGVVSKVRTCQPLPSAQSTWISHWSRNGASGC